MITAAFNDPDAVIRHAAARILAAKASDRSIDQLVALLDDDDAMVRATAVGACGRHDQVIALKALADTSPAVRRAAMEALLAVDEPEALSEGLPICLAAGHADILIEGQHRNGRVREHLLAFIRDGQPSRLEILTALETLAATSS